MLDVLNVMRDPLDEEGDVLPPQKLPYGAQLAEQNKILDKAAEMISKMRKKLKNGYGKRLPFQDGFLMSINALKMLYSDLTNRFPEEPIRILTYRINQDALENFFSLMRSAGSNTNPGPVEFINRINNYILGNNVESIMKDASSNVMFEQDLRPVLSAQVIALFNLINYSNRTMPKYIFMR